MNRDRVEAQLRNIERLTDVDNPPLLSLVVVANGDGVAVVHPLLKSVISETPEQVEAALRLVRTFLVKIKAVVDEDIEMIIRESARERTAADRAAKGR
jgi:intracellular sulfur oxidation DsrE/DsrF family protein